MSIEKYGKFVSAIEYSTRLKKAQMSQHNHELRSFKTLSWYFGFYLLKLITYPFSVFFPKLCHAMNSCGCHYRYNNYFPHHPTLPEHLFERHRSTSTRRHRSRGRRSMSRPRSSSRTTHNRRRNDPVRHQTPPRRILSPGTHLRLPNSFFEQAQRNAETRPNNSNRIQLVRPLVSPAPPIYSGSVASTLPAADPHPEQPPTFEATENAQGCTSFAV